MDKNLSDKIPCVIWTFYNFDIIKLTLEFLISENKFDIYVIENESINTKEFIQPFIKNLLIENKIKKYVFFHENISNNAIELFFDSNILKLNSKYILISDGDLIVENDILNWLHEEINIIEKRNDVASCGINLSLHNLPRFKGIIPKIPDTDGIIHENCIEFDTGIHLLLIKVEEFKDFLKWRKSTNSRFIDESLRYYFKNIKKYKWVVTKFNHANHLTWDIYNNLDHPYTKFKINNEFKVIWKHNNYCNFTIFDENGKNTKYPFKAFKTKIKHIIFCLKNIYLKDKLEISKFNKIQKY